MKKKMTGSEVQVGGSGDFFPHHMILQEQLLTGRAAIRDFICFQGSEGKSRWSSAQFCSVQGEKLFFFNIIHLSIHLLSPLILLSGSITAVLTEKNEYGKVTAAQQQQFLSFFSHSLNFKQGDDCLFQFFSLLSSQRQ